MQAVLYNKDLENTPLLNTQFDILLKTLLNYSFTVEKYPLSAIQNTSQRAKYC